MGIHTTQDIDNPNINKVSHLLNKLDELKKQGASPLERLRVIQEDGGRVLANPYFSMLEAWDVQQRHRSERQKKLNEISERVNHLKALWKVAPFTDEVNDAGGNLISYLDEFVQAAERTERKSEIEDLSAIWETAPDVSDVFGCTPITPQSKRRKSIEEQQQKLDEDRKLLMAETARVIDEVEREKDQPVEMPDDGEKTVEEAHEEGLKEIAKLYDGVTTPKEKEAFKKQADDAKLIDPPISPPKPLIEEVLKQTMDNLPPMALEEKPEEHDPARGAWEAAKQMEEETRALDNGRTTYLSEMKVVDGDKMAPQKGWSSAPSHDISAPRPKPNREEVPFEGDRLTGEVWGKALTKVLGEDYLFDLSAKNSLEGFVGITMIWRSTLDGVSTSKRALNRCRLNMWEPEDGKFKVELILQSDKWGNHKVRGLPAMTAEELNKLHDDPEPWLRDHLDLSKSRV